MSDNYYYDILEPDDDINRALDTLTRDFAPLYTDSWVHEKQAAYGRPYEMNVSAFSAMWLNKSLKIFMAYDKNGTPVGYLIGMVFRPLPYNATVFQVEDWYAKGNHEVENGLFQYLHTALRFLACDELWLSLGPRDRAPNLDLTWEEASRFQQVRYVRRR